MNKIYNDTVVLIIVCLINRGSSTVTQVFDYISSIDKSNKTLKELSMCLANMENEKLITKNRENGSTKYSVLKAGENFYKVRREEFKKTLVVLSNFYSYSGNSYEV